MSSTECNPPASIPAARTGRWLSHLMLALVAWVGLGLAGFDAQAQDRRVATTGSDSGNDCTVSTCRTIAHALSEANPGDTIIIGYGQSGHVTFSEHVAINKAGITIRAEGGFGNNPDVPGSSASIVAPDNSLPALITVNATGVTIQNLYLDVNFNNAYQGIRVESGDDLEVENVRIRARQLSPNTVNYGQRNAIWINPTAAAGAFSAVVTGSHIEGTPAQSIWFRAGIDARNAGLLAIGNTIRSVNHDIYVVGHPAGQAVTIGGPDPGDANTFRGYGVSYYAPASGAGTATIQNNTFTAAADLGGNVPSNDTDGDFAATRLIHNAVGQTVAISDNTFTGYQRGILIQNFPGVTLAGNEFTPLAGSTTFQHVRLSNKELFSGAAPAPIANALALTATGNTFNGTDGTGVYLLNDNAQAEPVGGYYGTILLEDNTFDGNLGHYIALSELVCASSNAAPCPTATSYIAASATMVGTPVVPFAGNVTAPDNSFGSVPSSAAATVAELVAINAKTQDRRDHVALGLANTAIGVIVFGDENAAYSLSDDRTPAFFLPKAPDATFEACDNSENHTGCYQLSLTNDGGTAVPEHTSIEFRITRGTGDEAIEAGNVVLDYETTPATGAGDVISFVLEDEILVGRMPVPAGNIDAAPVAIEANETDNLLAGTRLRFTRGGQYTVETRLIGKETEDLYGAVDTDTINVADLTLSIDGPSAADLAGTHDPATYTIAIANTDGAVTEPLAVRIRVSGDDAMVATDLALTYAGENDCVVDNDDLLCTFDNGGAGFTVAAGGSVSHTMTVDFAIGDHYTYAFEVVSLSGTPERTYATGTIDTRVGAVELTATGPARAANVGGAGTDATYTLTLDNTNGGATENLDVKVRVFGQDELTCAALSLSVTSFTPTCEVITSGAGAGAVEFTYGPFTIADGDTAIHTINADFTASDIYHLQFKAVSSASGGISPAITYDTTVGYVTTVAGIEQSGRNTFKIRSQSATGFSFDENISNDYTRINLAVQQLQTDDALELAGEFDWSASNPGAHFAWQFGSDGTGATIVSAVPHISNRYSLTVPADVDNLLITSAVACSGDDVVTCGATIKGPGVDDPDEFLERFLSFRANKNLSITNLRIEGFEIGLYLFKNDAPNPAGGFLNLSISGNEFVVPADEADVEEAPDSLAGFAYNRAIVAGHTANATLSNNRIWLAGGGAAGTYETSPWPHYSGSRSVGIELVYVGGDGTFVDGTAIAGNIITPLGSSGGELIGIWDNANANASGELHIANNRFHGTAAGTGQIGVRLSSCKVNVTDNLITDSSVALGWSDEASDPSPSCIVAGGVAITRNTLLDNDVAVHVASNARNALHAAISNNRIVGGSKGFHDQRTSPATITANDNWWGTNTIPAGYVDGVTPASHLQLVIEANPTTIDAGAAIGPGDESDITVRFVSSATPADTYEDFDFLPLASYTDPAYTDSKPNSLAVVGPGGVSQSTLDFTGTTPGADEATYTPAAQGVAAVNATVDGQTVSIDILTLLDDPTPTVLVQSISASNGELEPGDVGYIEPTALDNDYTRINRAVQLLTTGTTLLLEGTFHWDEPFAMASWENNNYQIAAPPGYANVTIRGTRDDEGTPSDIKDDTYSASVIADTTGIGVNRPVRFIRALNGSYQGWAIIDLRLVGFERPISMVSWADGDGPYPGAPIDAMSGLTITGNRIEMSSQRTTATSSNMAVSFGPGDDIHLNGNHLVIAGDRYHETGRSTYGFMNYTTGGSSYAGLQINDNLIQVGWEEGTGVPERVVAIWENTANGNGLMEIVGNRIVQIPAVTDPDYRHRRVAIMPNHASDNLSVVANEVDGWGFGFTYMASDIVGFSMAAGNGEGAVLVGNTFVNNQTAIRSIGVDVGLNAHSNRIVGGQGFLNAATGTSAAASIDDNWWGCNAGLDGGLGCATQSGLADLPASWLQLKATATPDVLDPPTTTESGILIELVSTSSGNVATSFPATTIDLTTTKGSFHADDPLDVTDVVTNAGENGDTTLYQHVSGYAFLSASLDNQIVDFNVRVDGAVTVNDNVAAGEILPAGATCGAPDFSSIQDAINTVPAGTTILVCPGTYPERLTIGKKVTLLGAQAGVDGRDRNSDNLDSGESVLLPATTDPTISMGSYFTSRLIGIGGAAVVIDGFVLDGDNPDLTSGVSLNGADIDATAGILASGSSAGLEVRNNIIRNMQSGGVFGYAHVGDNIIEFNRFSNIAAPSEWGVGVLSTTHWYAQIRDNLFDGVRVGVHSNLLNLANPGTLEPAVLRNEFRVQYRGVFLNQNGGSVATSHRIEGNSFSPVAAAGMVEPWQAIWIQGLTGSRQIQITDNHINGSGLAGRTRIGYYLNNITSTAAATTRFISGGSVSNVDVGVLATDAGYYRGPVNDFVVRDVTFTGVDAALYVEDTTHTGNARLSLGSGNNFLGATWPVTLAGPDATLGTADGETGAGLVRVRAAQASNVWGGPDEHGGLHAVAAGSINNGIAGAASTDAVVQVEAGSFAQTVTVNKPVRLLGAQAGVDAKNAVGARAGGETIISPDAPVRIGIPATGSGAEVDGFTITGSSATAPGSSSAFSITASGVKVRNNRIIDINGHGVYLSNTLTQDILIEQNRFADISGGSFNGVRTEASNDLRVIGNSFSNIAYQGIQLGGSNLGAQLLANRIEGTVHGGINIGGGSDIVISRNTLASADTSGSADRAAIRIYGGVDAVVSCNVIEASNHRGVYFHSSGSTHVANVFHNAILASTAALVNGHAGQTLVGSNWYNGAGAPVVAGTLIADPLDANPVLNTTDCGNNTPATLIAISGTPQDANVNQPFGSDLVARLQDALGGAVVNADVTLTSPASGTSATLNPPSPAVQATDFNGEVRASATANNYAGSYNVVASSTAVADLSYVLTNLANYQVLFDIDGPVAGVKVGETVAYAGTLSNNDPALEEVYLRIRVSATDDASAPIPLAADDVLLNAFHPINGSPLALGWPLSQPFPGELSAQFPADATGGVLTSLDIRPVSPATVFESLQNLAAMYARPGLYQAQIEVVGAVSGTVYAIDSVHTEVIDEHAGVSLDLQGPVAGVEKGANAEYNLLLSNTEAAVADEVRIELVFTRGGGITAGDIDKVYYYDSDTDDYVLLPLIVGVAELSTSIGPYTLDDGSTTPVGILENLRIVYNVAPHTFQIAATVVDASADTDGVALYAGDNIATDVIEADPDVELDLSGPFNGEDDTLVVARVDESMVVRADLVNNGGPVADQVQASFTVGAGFDIQTDDLVARYWFLPGATGVCDTDTAVGIVAVAESEFTDTGNTLSISTSPQSLTEGMEVAVCFEFTFSHAGVYSIGTVIEDAIPDTDGLATYAADNLALTVGKGEATLAFDASTIGAFAWDGSIREAVVETDPVGLEDDVTITYNGDSVAPSNAGSYTVVATLSHADYEADLITGAIVIGGESVDISGIEFVAGGTSQVFDGSDWPVTFIADPAAGAEGIACDVSINGGASLPNTVGSYFVTVTCEGPNHFGAASNMLTITKATGTVQFAPLSGAYGTVHAVTASLAQSD
ncbi:right-handed parallel beta-helix repeat-containing protein, partial [Xanthomonadaceae bacterium JHOS43]|nr:right-handed parallel beta-helix repeat-containing protein [Xanthomonadaceae bacterium JHOS43]